MPATPVSAEIPPPVPATPKANFLTQPPTKEKRPFFETFSTIELVDSVDWKESDLATTRVKKREGLNVIYCSNEA